MSDSLPYARQNVTLLSSAGLLGKHSPVLKRQGLSSLLSLFRPDH